MTQMFSEKNVLRVEGLLTSVLGDDHMQIRKDLTMNEFLNFETKYGQLSADIRSTFLTFFLRKAMDDTSIQ